MILDFFSQYNACDIFTRQPLMRVTDEWIKYDTSYCRLPSECLNFVVCEKNMRTPLLPKLAMPINEISLLETWHGCLPRNIPVIVNL